MTERQWDGVVAVITANWPHQLPPENALAKWRCDLGDLDVRQVLVAVESLYRQGREFCPNGGQIRREVVRLALDVPEFSEVWATLWSAAGRLDFARRAEAREDMAALHALAGVLFDRLDWRELCFGESPPSVVEAQVRGKWAALTDGALRDVALAGLPSAGLPAIERANVGPRLIGAGLRAITGGKA